MRSAQDLGSSHSATPIYDALYAEYQRSFRALPGDRTGEEELGFTAFGPAGPGYSAGSYGTRQNQQGTASGGSTSVWQRQDISSLRQLPAALPPAPRRGT
ncbi:hypothetical protein [Streptomyces cavernae]|uniref:hypothetical protein n=1 Tax=Streptomyces cavernae TaxID=2259034 RepID=UPI0030B818A0